MSNISSIAMSGMQAATARLQTSANNIANPNSGSDLTGDIVDQMVAQVSFAANVQTMRADQKMTQALLDILA